MALTEVRRWLITYDIRERRRLARVHRQLSRVAVPVQYSVFAARGNLAAMRRLANDLRGLIDDVDDVRIYGIPQTPCVHTLGATMLPRDVWLLDGTADLTPLASASQRSAEA